MTRYRDLSTVSSALGTRRSHASRESAATSSSMVADLGSEHAVIDEGGGGDASLREEVAQCCGAGLPLDVDQVTLVGEDVTELDTAAGTAGSFDAGVQFE